MTPDFSPVTMKDKFASEIVDWHYEGEYAVYDIGGKPDVIDELLQSPNPRGEYAAVLDSDRRLAGFYRLDRHGKSVMLGLGLKPELTGRGMGESFVRAGVLFAVRTCKTKRVLMRVAAFNRRALRACEKAGFMEVRRYLNDAEGDEGEYVELVCDSKAD